MKTWINKKTLGGLFLAVILLLTFFSRTIYTWHLPQVKGVKPFQGQLSKVEVGQGTVQWAQTDAIYIPENGTVREMYVSAGEYVTAGQQLFSLEYDTEDNEQKLQEIENSRSTLQLEIQNLNLEIEAAKHPDAELLNTRQLLTEAETYLNGANQLYAIGGISSQELTKAGNEVNYLRLKLENEQRKAAEQGEILQRRLDAKILELEKLAIEEAPLRRTQAIHHSQTVITAKRDGMLLAFHVEAGRKVTKDTLAAEIGVGNDYILKCPVSLDNNFIVPGDSCSLSNASHQLKGVVTGLRPSEQEKTVEIQFTAEGVTAGETFEVLFQKKSTASYTLVPNAAVNKDKDGYYLKQLKRRDGIMGKEYYLDRIDIYIGDSDAQNTAVIQGVTFYEPVMLSGNKKAEAGDTVLLKNAGDFFEK